MTNPTTPTPPEGLTDEQLFKLAADALGYVAITHSDEDLPGAYEASGLELLAAMRAAIAADRAARPTPTPEEIEATFRQWWAESYPNAPVNKASVGYHVAFALHLLSRGVQ
jgi:hypothetical protein